jgi:hypothetical protein
MQYIHGHRFFVIPTACKALNTKNAKMTASSDESGSERCRKRHTNDGCKEREHTPTVEKRKKRRKPRRGILGPLCIAFACVVLLIVTFWWDKVDALLNGNSTECVLGFSSSSNQEEPSNVLAAGISEAASSEGSPFSKAAKPGNKRIAKVCPLGYGPELSEEEYRKTVPHIPFPKASAAGEHQSGGSSECDTLYDSRQYESALDCYEAHPLNQVKSPTKDTVSLHEKKALCLVNMDDQRAVAVYLKAISFQRTILVAAPTQAEQQMVELVLMRLLESLTSVQRQHHDDTGARKSLKQRLAILQRMWRSLGQMKQTTAALHGQIASALQDSAAWAIEQQDMMVGMQYFQELQQHKAANIDHILA